jgi:ubiquinone/menaquinone biosynthesis C-methylase UbiE
MQGQASPASPVRAFVDRNQAFVRRVEPRLPQSLDLDDLWAQTVARRMNELPAGAVVVDVGGGRSCRFAGYRQPDDGRRLIAIDVSEEELAHNTDVDEKRVADVVEGLPLADASVDMIVSRSVVEHLADSEAFIAHAARALKPGGWLINLFPSKWAPFSVANRALPESVSRRFLYFIWPEDEGVGFRTYYDNCSVRAMSRALDRQGFDVVDRRVNYYQSTYLAFFVPVWALGVLYELAVWGLGLEQLGASVLISARKR